MYARGQRVREIECKGDCMQMQAVSSIKARRFHFEKGVCTTVPLGHTPPPRAFFYAPSYSDHAVQMREIVRVRARDNRLRVTQLIGASRAEKNALLLKRLLYFCHAMSRGIDYKRIGEWIKSN